MYGDLDMPCTKCSPLPPPKPKNTRQAKVYRGELLSKRRIEELKAKCRSEIRFNQKLKKQIIHKKEILEEEVARQEIYTKKRKRIELNKREKKMRGWNTRVSKLHHRLKTYMKRNTCKVCEDKLIIDVNISSSRYKNSDYECNKCLSEKYKIPGAKPGRPVIYKTRSEALAAQRKQKREENERKKRIFPPGVYIIWWKELIFYIGESHKIYTRVLLNHFGFWLGDNYDGSPVQPYITKENIHEFKWAMVAYENDKNKRVALEQQYIHRYCPRVNAPYIHLTDDEHLRMQKYILSLDKGIFELPKDLVYYSPLKTEIKSDLIQRIETHLM